MINNTLVCINKSSTGFRYFNDIFVSWCSNSNHVIIWDEETSSLVTNEVTLEGFSSGKSWQESWQDSALLNAICENRATIRVNFLVSSFWWFGVNGFSSP